MAPKFRGNSDDWLDDQEAQDSSGSRGHRSGLKGGKPKAVALEKERANATVAEVFPNQCRVRMDEGGAEFLCAYRRAGVFGHSEKNPGDHRERSPVAVGDRVLARQTSPDSGVIEGVCARWNSLVRPAPGKGEKQGDQKVRHVIAANVDGVAIIASVREPSFSIGLVDRYLVAATAAGIPAWICVTKIDLHSEGQQAEWDLYRALGFKVLEVSAKRGDGVELLREELHEKTIVFSGQSGVGKTSLLRALLGAEIGRVAEISASTGKGRHTTTSAVMIGGSRWIDTPGVREFGLLGVTPHNLSHYFPEFRGLQCAVAGCLHIDEHGCVAHELIRYPSYRRIYESLLAGEN